MGADDLEDETSVGRLRRTEAVVAAINTLPGEIDFVVHLGDLVEDSSTVFGRNVCSLLSALRWQTYFVRGNHDAASPLWELLGETEVERPFPERDWVCYSFWLREVEFVTLDAQPTEPWHGVVPLEQIEFLQSKLAGSSRVVVFLHYQPLPIDCEFADNVLQLTNGLNVHTVLCEAGSKVGGVFYGHIHRGIVSNVDGVLYSSAAAIADEFELYATTKYVRRVVHNPASFQLVTIDKGSTIVKTISVPV